MARKNRKKCAHCDEPSLPGLKKGWALCQYHWDVRAYGVTWANHCRDLRREGKK